jgi:hypothetical protein
MVLSPNVLFSVLSMEGIHLEAMVSSALLSSSSSISGGGALLQRLGSASLAGTLDLQQLSSGTTLNNSAAGGSGAVILTRCVAYL